jgi:hypothetical protein
VKFAVADSIKRTSGIIAIICLVAFGLFFILNDMFGLGIYLFGKNTTVTKKNLNKHKNREVKPVYLPSGGTKY